MAEYFNIIKYEGDNETFIWKHPCEDFNMGTQLIVHESQEAVFFMNGQALDLFGAGRHTLDSQNIPLVGKFFNLSTNDETPFHCEVYFINKTEQMGIKWGTSSQLEYMEPTYNFPIKIGASGEMNIAVLDSRKLLVKVVGTEKGISQASLVRKLRAFLMTRVKTYLAILIKEYKINIFSIDEYLTQMSITLKEKLAPDYEEYGLDLVHFFVTTIVKPEDDKMYLRFKDLYFRQYADVAEAELNQRVGIIDQHTQSQRMIIESRGIAEKRATENYTYQQERGFDVSEKIAENEGVGEFSNLGIGLGMVAGVGGTIGGTVGNIMSDSLDDLSKNDRGNEFNFKCFNCGKQREVNQKFCSECGQNFMENQSNEIICPNCNSKIEKGKFCTECGYSIAKG